jgi:hypothetical protein
MAELFIIGAQRSGTTYLYNVLDAHPQILMAKPVRPEPKFFLKEDQWAKGKKYYESLYFQSRRAEHIFIGEKSTSYIEYKVAAARIKSFYPEARILVILRDPVERTYSNYRFSVENGIENLSFIEALSAEQERLSNTKYNASVNPYAYQRRGHYIDYINHYSDVFDESQIYVIIHEEFVSNSSAISKLYSWLGVDESYVSRDYKERVNVSTASSVNAQKLLEYENNLCEKFIESNENLEEYLGREIPAWKR